MSEIIGSLIRKLLTAAGGFLIAKGWVTDGQWADIVTAAIGLALTVIPVVWSLVLRWWKARQAGK